MKIAPQIVFLLSVVSLAACDMTPPLLVQIKPVPTITHSASPSYTFSSNEAGKIIYSGSCQSSNDSAIVGNNTIKFNSLAVGKYADCKIVVQDLKGNASEALVVNTFEYTPLELKEVKQVPSLVTSAAPEYVFSSNSAGTIIVAGSCTSTDTKAVLGENTIKFSNLADDLQYVGCTVSVKDAEGNISPPLVVNTFVVDKFTKIDNLGNPLEASADTWSCVRDNETNLLWEEKTNDKGLHHAKWGYSWYNPDRKTNGGNEGYSHQRDLCFEKNRCDTLKFVEDVNKTNLCGRSDWRLPTKEQLFGLLTCVKPNCVGVKPHINDTYFSNPMYYYWSSTPDKGEKDFAFAVDYGKGEEMFYVKSHNIEVRLVSGQ